MMYHEKKIIEFMDDIQNHWEDLDDLIMELCKEPMFVENKTDWSKDVLYLTYRYMGEYIDIYGVYQNYRVFYVEVDNNEYERKMIDDIILYTKI